MQKHGAHASDRLIGGGLNGKLSRRGVLRRAAALGLAVPFAGAVGPISGRRAARAQGTTPAAQEPGFSIVAPTNLRTDLAGQRITVILGADGPGVPWEEAAVAAFTEATGIEVERLSGAEQATERLT